MKKIAKSNKVQAAIDILEDAARKCPYIDVINITQPNIDNLVKARKNLEYVISVEESRLLRHG